MLIFTRSTTLAALVASAALMLPTIAQADERDFAAGSLIIPMDMSYQDTGMFQAYGLLFQLLRQGVPVSWVIDPNKTWHAADCDAAADNCAWDCMEEGSGVKCSYPTASPDFFAGATVVHDSDGAMSPGDTITSHGYRGGPFVIDSVDAGAARIIIDEWNDTNSTQPWSVRTIFHKVSVHEASAGFTGFVRKEMIAAPSIAVFSDGNEELATAYLRAAGIYQSSGDEFPAGKCGADNCGPGTDNPDMLTVPSIMGDMGTCEAPNYDHRNGSLFNEDGLPAFCQIMSMHWDVGLRETVECDGGGCPNTQAECNGETFTYHGHEVVAEVRKFLEYPVHFFAECQAVNAYENTTPNPNWPYLDDDARDGHFLTTEGTPPPCPCTHADFTCVVGGCDGADCCLTADNKKRKTDIGAGFLVADKPDSATIQILHPEVAYNQLDGAFGTTGGSEPAYNLSAYLGTEYKNGRDVTFITGPNGPGDQDIWMTGYVDGECDILGDDDVQITGAGDCNGGKVSYLGGHKYVPSAPMSSSDQNHGARLFLNALFEADCVTSVGQPSMYLDLNGQLVVPVQSVPAETEILASFANQGRGAALESIMSMTVPTGVELVAATDGTINGTVATWDVGSVSADPALAGAAPSSGTKASTLRFADFGEYSISLEMSYLIGQTTLQAPERVVTIAVRLDTDGDGVADVDDSAPNDPTACGDSDNDTCDDCSSGSLDPANDGTDTDGDGTCDAGETNGDGDGDGDGSGSSGGCGCGISQSGSVPAWPLFLLGLIALGRRRRKKN